MFKTLKNHVGLLSRQHLALAFLLVLAIFFSCKPEVQEMATPSTSEKEQKAAEKIGLPDFDVNNMALMFSKDKNFIQMQVSFVDFTQAFLNQSPLRDEPAKAQTLLTSVILAKSEAEKLNLLTESGFSNPKLIVSHLVKVKDNLNLVKSSYDLTHVSSEDLQQAVSLGLGMTGNTSTNNLKFDCCDAYRHELFICTLPALFVTISIWLDRYVPISISLHVLKDLWECTSRVEEKYRNCCYQ
jgi:hypothetical protein